MNARVKEDFHCIDCGVDTAAIAEYFMVYGIFWRPARMSPAGGLLCIGCLETRLGHPLRKRDFPALPINDTPLGPQSERLRARLERR